MDGSTRPSDLAYGRVIGVSHALCYYRLPGAQKAGGIAAFVEAMRGTAAAGREVVGHRDEIVVVGLADGVASQGSMGSVVHDGKMERDSILEDGKVS